MSIASLVPKGGSSWWQVSFVYLETHSNRTHTRCSSVFLDLRRRRYLIGYSRAPFRSAPVMVYLAENFPQLAIIKLGDRKARPFAPGFPISDRIPFQNLNEAGP